MRTNKILGDFFFLTCDVSAQEESSDSKPEKGGAGSHPTRAAWTRFIVSLGKMVGQQRLLFDHHTHHIVLQRFGSVWSPPSSLARAGQAV